jgi:AraC-like DNA-binding protein
MAHAPTPNPRPSAALSSWMRPCAHPVYARLLCATLLKRGFKPEQILQGSRLNWDALHTGHALLSFNQLHSLIAQALTLTQCPWLGLEVGLGTDLAAHGAVGYAGMASRDVEQALELLPAYSALRQNLMAFSLHKSEALTMLELQEDLPDASAREYVLGHITGAVFRLLQTITGQDWSADVTVDWPMPAPAWADAYRQQFPRISFGASHWRITLSAAQLTTPTLAADPLARNQAVRDCERLLAQQRSGQLTERIRARLLACEGEYPSLPAMAAHEHLSPRSLMRHLHSEGSSYQALLDQVRQDAAFWLLSRSNATVEDIAVQLGYSDPSNFSRTFRRWTGQTPSEFRGLATAAMMA